MMIYDNILQWDITDLTVYITKYKTVYHHFYCIILHLYIRFPGPLKAIPVLLLISGCTALVLSACASASAVTSTTRYQAAEGGRRLNGWHSVEEFIKTIMFLHDM